MELNEFLDRLDEVSLSKLIAKVKSGNFRLDDDDKARLWTESDSGIVKDDGTRATADEVIQAFKEIKVTLSPNAIKNIRTATAHVEHDAEAAMAQDRKEKRKAEVENSVKLRDRVPSLQADYMKGARG